MPESTEHCFAALTAAYPTLVLSELGPSGNVSLGYCRGMLQSLISSGRILVLVQLDMRTARLVEVPDAGDEAPASPEIPEGWQVGVHRASPVRPGDPVVPVELEPAVYGDSTVTPAP